MEEQLKGLALEEKALTNEKIRSEAVENYANANAKEKQAEVNAFNAIAMVEDNELDRDRE
jgi:hypothetical protein